MAGCWRSVGGWAGRRHVADVGTDLQVCPPDRAKALSLPTRADVDLTVVMTDGGKLVEVEGCAEGEPFSVAALQRLVSLARRGIGQLVQVQKKALRRQV